MKLAFIAIVLCLSLFFLSSSFLVKSDLQTTIDSRYDKISTIGDN